MALTIPLKGRKILIPLLAFLATVVFLLPCYAASKKTAAAKPETPKPSPAPVIFDNKVLFSVQARVLSFSPQERAKLIGERIRKLAGDPTILPEKITSLEGDMSSDIAAGDLVIMTVTEDDARAAGISRAELAREYARLLKTAIEDQRKAYSLRSILLGLLFTFLLSAFFAVALYFIRKIFFKTYALLETAKKERIPAVKFQQLEIISAEQVGNALIYVAKLVYAAILMLGIYFYIVFVLTFFPWTKNLSSKIAGYITTPLSMIVQAIEAYLPDLFVLSMIALITYYGLKLIKFIFRAIERQVIVFPAFYPEWARPTYSIVRFLIISLAVVVAFPYLPGSSSPAFQGVSIFLGVLLSLGSTSAVANVVAGIIITYMMAFKDGDRVRISDTTGDVVEKTLLVTRIRTIKNEYITIPNAMILGSHIVNYSSSASQPGLILHTSVTIGYDAPWRKVHELLIAAAGKTAHILKEPPPFVLQTALDDFYVHYELNAYTDQPSKMADIYSDLHQNIQDCFNEAGVEIMSPHYSSLRDGNRTAVPDDYLPSGYASRPFRVLNEGEPRK